MTDKPEADELDLLIEFPEPVRAVAYDSRFYHTEPTEIDYATPQIVLRLYRQNYTRDEAMERSL